MKKENFGHESQYAAVPLGGIDEVDRTVADLIEAEAERQDRKLIFIASESICPPAVRRAMASPLAHIYAEGYPAPRMNVLTEDEISDFDHAFVNFRRYSDRRYYKGTDYMNVIESLAKRRCSDLFANDRMSSDHIFANVQSLSGAAANNAVYQAFLQNGDRILGMSLVSGGHLTHGSPVNRSGRTYNVASYSVGRDGKLDYEAIEQQAREFLPRLIVAGFSAYPWDIDWEALRKAADSVGALLMADISHTAGLVAAGVVNSPVGFADVMTFTTHKTLCGPRGAVILTTDEAHAKAVDLAVFPGEQGGPHMHQIAAKAVAFKLAQQKEFKDTMKKVVNNASAMGESFKKRGFELAYGGTDTHLLLLDLKKVKTASGNKITGEIASRLLDNIGITCNKNTIAGDTSANHPSGLRFGTTWVTQRGFGPEELDRTAELVCNVLKGAHAYTYFYAGGDVGRAKLEFDLMEEVQRGVQDLVKKAGDVKGEWEKQYPHFESPVEALNEKEEARPTPMAAPALQDGKPSMKLGRWLFVESYGEVSEEKNALMKSAGLVDMGGVQWVRVSGRRAALFLESVTTAEVLSLKPGQGVGALVLSPNGEMISDAAVLREETQDTSRTWHDSFLMRLGPTGDSDAALRWLRALSDGYTYHDEDIYLKAEGPALLTSLDEEEGGFTAFSLCGPEAQKVLGGVVEDKSLKIPDPGCYAGLQIDGEDVVVFRRGESGCLFGGDGGGRRGGNGGSDGDEQVAFEIAAPVESAKILWGRSLEKGAKVCGLKAVREVHESACSCGFEYGASSTECGPKELLSSPYSKLVFLKKPFFIGQKALLKTIEDEIKDEAAGHLEVGGVEDPGVLKEQLQPVKREEWAKALEVEQEEDRTTCLYEEHLKLTKKRNIIPFAGWKMPVWYDSIISEHEAVRKGAGLFDVSHMGVLSFTGPNAERFLDLVTTNYVPWLNPGQCQYSYLLDHEGNVIDDIIVYRETRDRFMMVVNAANAEVDEAWMRSILKGVVPLEASCPLKGFEGGVEIRNMKLDESLGDDRRVDLALQGPASLQTLFALMSDSEEKRKLAELPSFHLMEAHVGGMKFWIARTGYTGEAVGFELFPHPDKAVELWNMILDKGRDFGVVPAGLGARDSTRLEAGFPLHGHELAGEHAINPLEAGYAPFVRLHKPYFVGRGFMLDAYKNWKRTVVRLQTTGTGGRTIRPGAPVVDARRGTCVGTITSSVTVDKYQVGLAIVDRKRVREGDLVMVYPVTGGKVKKGAKAPEELQPGDRTSLPLEAKIISRFMKPGETRASALE